MGGFDRKLENEIATGERWLATFETAPPSTASVERVKRAVRAELGGARPGFRTGRWAVWHGVLAAAAAIALAVTVAWHSVRSDVQSARSIAGRWDIPTWSTETAQEAVVLADLDQELSELEAWSVEEAWDWGGSALYEAMERALNETPDGDPAEAGTSMRRSRTFIKTEEV